MRKLPDLIFIVDTHTEALAVKEANKVKVPVLGIVDTNADPDPIDYVIPANDDAIRSVKLIVSLIANAAEEGLRIREVEMLDTGQVSPSRSGGDGTVSRPQHPGQAPECGRIRG